jgi:hypothetical protein
MSDQLPDRLNIDPRSPHYNENILKRGVSIRFNGAQETNVEEYCVSRSFTRNSCPVPEFPTDLVRDPLSKIAPQPSLT